VQVAQAHAPGGYEIRVHDGRAYVATFTTQEGVSVFDVTDPAAPVHLGGTPPGPLARSVDVLDYGDRLAVATSTGTELEVWDLTDPAAPTRLAQLRFGSHNVAVHPTARIVYNARNLWDGVGGAMEIVDARDPLHVRLDHTFTFPHTARDGSVVKDQGCHDFSIDVEVQRMYCPAYEQTLVFDITDPWHPEIVTAITNPAITSHHTAFTILNGTVLVISDEFADNAMWGCLTAPADAAPPLSPGGLWFYDLAATPPQPIGYLSGPPATPEAWFLTPHGINAMCTSHNGGELEPGSGVIAYGWFDAGLTLLDASDPRHPVLLDTKDVAGAFGDARYADGHIYAADDKTGLTVFRVEG
jgi:hypothetical protein